MPASLITEIICPICLISFNSHLSFRATGALVDEHVKAKHPEYLTDSEFMDSEELVRYRERGLRDNDLFEDPTRPRL